MKPFICARPAFKGLFILKHMELKPPQHIEYEYNKFKKEFPHTSIMYNYHTHHFYVSIFPITMLKSNLFTIKVK